MLAFSLGIILRINKFSRREKTAELSGKIKLAHFANIVSAKLPSLKLLVQIYKDPIETLSLAMF